MVIFIDITEDKCIEEMYSVSQKSSPLKLFAIFSLRLSVFS